MIKSELLRLERVLKQPLPGVEAQQRMAPNVRHEGENWPDPKFSQPSGVLILLFPKENELFTVLIRRTQIGPHAGQISLPGGKQEPGDQNIIHTALRETEEEIGISVNDVHVLGKLTPLFVSHSNFCINPVVGTIDYFPVFSPNHEEVEEIISISLSALYHPTNNKKRVFYRGNTQIIAPYFDVEGHKVWGATAMILSEFKALSL